MDRRPPVFATWLLERFGVKRQNEAPHCLLMIAGGLLVRSGTQFSIISAGGENQSA